MPRLINPPVDSDKSVSLTCPRFFACYKNETREGVFFEE